MLSAVYVNMIFQEIHTHSLPGDYGFDPLGLLDLEGTGGLKLLKAVKVDAIIGAQKSAQANFVMDLGDIAKVPVISFSATSTSLCLYQAFP
nr:glutamate receptor 2.8-like [Ipomoea batatas]